MVTMATNRYTVNNSYWIILYNVTILQWHPGCHHSKIMKLRVSGLLDREDGPLTWDGPLTGDGPLREESHWSSWQTIVNWQRRWSRDRDDSPLTEKFLDREDGLLTEEMVPWLKRWSIDKGDGPLTEKMVHWQRRWSIEKGDGVLTEIVPWQKRWSTDIKDCPLTKKMVHWQRRWQRIMKVSQQVYLSGLNCTFYCLLLSKCNCFKS